MKKTGRGRPTYKVEAIPGLREHSIGPWGVDLPKA